MPQGARSRLSLAPPESFNNIPNQYTNLEYIRPGDLHAAVFRG